VIDHLAAEIEQAAKRQHLSDLNYDALEKDNARLRAEVERLEAENAELKLDKSAEDREAAQAIAVVVSDVILQSRKDWARAALRSVANREILRYQPETAGRDVTVRTLRNVARALGLIGGE